MSAGITPYPLGRTGLSISPIGLGCWQFSGGKGVAGAYWEGLDTERVQAIVDESLAGGISWFDTAEVYGWGESERSLARALRANGAARETYLIATKWFPLLKRAATIGTTIGEREQALDGLGIDLHQIHFPASISAIPRQMEAMAALVRDGHTRAIGVSNFSASQMRRAHAALTRHGLVLATNQVRYSLLDRAIERNGILDAANELGITIIAYSPLAQGILTGRFHAGESIGDRPGPRKRLPAFSSRGLERTRPLIEELRRIAEGHEGVSPAQVALAWTIRRHGTTVVAIPGASSVAQAQSNARSMRLDLSDGEIASITRAADSVR